MNYTKRKTIKLFAISILSLFVLPYKFLYSVTKKIINPKLTKKQKEVMLNEDTERPFSSPLNTGKRFCNNGLCLIFKPTD